MRRAGWAVLLAAGLSFGALAPPAQAATTPIAESGTTRLAGADRYATAVAVSQASFTAPVDAVFLASGQAFPDALAGGPAAAKAAAPLLLTRPDRLPDVVLTELQRLAPATVYLLGGDAAIEPAVAATLTGHGFTVTRLSGADRYATAAAVADTWPAGTDTVYLASGLSFPDALSGGAAAAHDGSPVLLTGPATLPPDTEAALSRLAPARVVILGGTGVVSSAVVTAVQALLPAASVTRLGGADRFATSAAIASASWPSGASTVFYASGLGFADALAGVPAAAVNDAPLLLAGAACLSSHVADATDSFAAQRHVLLGGTSALPTTAMTPCGRPGTALAALATLAVKGRAPKTGYTRDQFGPAWTDVDHNGCDTRNDILRRDLTDIVIKTDTKGCVVASGTLDDPYTVTTIFFVRGPDSADVQIDHVVALSDAWQKGAQQWAADTRKAFANDPLNLLAVDGPTNASKGDGDAATWLPPNKAYRCAYVARQIAVKAKYNAWITTAEHDAMATVLATCPDQKLPSNVSVPPPAESPTDPTPPPTDVYYTNCDAVRAAGAAPLYAGQPGYRAGLDRDGDGVACEA